MTGNRNPLGVKMVCILLLTGLLCCSVSASATRAAVTGPDTVLPGERLVLVFSLEGSGICGVSGTVSYDRDLLTLEDGVCLMPGGWRLDIRGDRFLAYDESLEAPILGMTPLITFTFSVNSDLSEGTEILVCCRDLIVTDGEGDILVDAAVYSASIPVSEPVTEATEVPAETTVPTEITEPEYTEPEITEPGITEPHETVPVNTAEPADPTETEQVDTLPQRTEPTIQQQVTVPTAPATPMDEQQSPGSRILPAAVLCIASAIVLLVRIVRKKHGD